MTLDFYEVGNKFLVLFVFFHPRLRVGLFVMPDDTICNSRKSAKCKKESRPSLWRVVFARVVCQLCFVGTTADTVYDCVYVYVFLWLWGFTVSSSFTASVVRSLWPIFTTSNKHVRGLRFGVEVKFRIGFRLGLWGGGI